MDIISHYSAYTPARTSAASQVRTRTPEAGSTFGGEFLNMAKAQGRIGPGAALYNGSDTRAKLSDTEIAVLANKYDVRSMSDSEFDDFLDDLESMGVISGYEKRRLGYKGMDFFDVDDAKSGVLMMSAWVAPAVPGGSTLLFERGDANGDIFRWINERIQWEPGYSKNPVWKKSQEDCVNMHKALAGIINRMDSQQKSSAADAEKAELVRQLADKNSEFYTNMRTQLKAQVDKNQEDEEEQAIIDAMAAVLDAMSGREPVTGEKASVNKSASDLTKKIGDRIARLRQKDPDDPEAARLENMLKRLQEIGIYFDLNDMDDLWLDEDKNFETLTQLLTRRQAEEINSTHPIENEVNEEE